MILRNLNKQFSILLILTFFLLIPSNSIYAQEENPIESNMDSNLIDGIFIPFVISVLVIAVIIFIANKILTTGDNDNKLSNILRDKHWYPSLALLQFFAWTLVIIFAFFGIYLIRLFNGISDPPTEIPLFLFALMGISIATPILNAKVSSIVYQTKNSTPVKKPVHLPGFSTMLQENGKIVLTRFQMFSWTWIAIIVYLIVLFSDVQNAVNVTNFEELVLPDIDPVFLVLMGISQGAYLGGKLTIKQGLNITKIDSDKTKKTITITGTNFGNKKGVVTWDNDELLETDISLWTDTKIIISFSSLDSGKHTVRIGANVLMTVEKEYEILS